MNSLSQFMQVSLDACEKATTSGLDAIRTSHCCLTLLNSIVLARLTSSWPNSCSGKTSVHRQRIVPSAANEMMCVVLFICVCDSFFEVTVGLRRVVWLLLLRLDRSDNVRVAVVPGRWHGKVRMRSRRKR